MNREILFRGKHIHEWIFGPSILFFPDGEVYIYPEDGVDSPDSYQVNPKTVGQFTGEFDKNWNKIFEGDTLDNGYAVQMEDGRWLARKGISVIEAEYFCNFEITGTIHDYL